MIIWRNFFKASPQPSPQERGYRYYCLLISYETNLSPSPTERVGERPHFLFKLNIKKQKPADDFLLIQMTLLYRFVNQNTGSHRNIE